MNPEHSSSQLAAQQVAPRTNLVAAPVGGLCVLVLALVVVLGALGTLACSSAASVRVGEGQAPFWLSVGFDREASTSRAIHLLVVAAAVDAPYGTGTVAELRLGLPPGIECIAGDTLSRIALHEDRPRRFILRARYDGAYVLRPSLVIDDGRQSLRDEVRLEVPLEIRRNTIVGGTSREVVRLRRIAGKPHRFGGAFLVPIDEAEAGITQDEILVDGHRPEVVTRRNAVCADCSTAVRSVPWVVCLDSRGRFRHMKPHPAGGAESAAVFQTWQALSGWTFRPARVRDRPVSDCLFVEVRLDPPAPPPDLVSPRVRTSRPAHCPRCPLSSPRYYLWTLCLDAQGRLRKALPEEGSRRDSVAWAATRRALDGWTFHPATRDGRAVEGCLSVRVVLER